MASLPILEPPTPRGENIKNPDHLLRDFETKAKTYLLETSSNKIKKHDALAKLAESCGFLRADLEDCRKRSFAKDETNKKPPPRETGRLPWNPDHIKRLRMIFDEINKCKDIKRYGTSIVQRFGSKLLFQRVFRNCLSGNMQSSKDSRFKDLEVCLQFFEKRALLEEPVGREEANPKEDPEISPPAEEDLKEYIHKSPQLARKDFGEFLDRFCKQKEFTSGATKDAESISSIRARLENDNGRVDSIIFTVHAACAPHGKKCYVEFVAQGRLKRPLSAFGSHRILKVRSATKPPVPYYFLDQQWERFYVDPSPTQGGVRTWWYLAATTKASGLKHDNRNKTNPAEATLKSFYEYFFSSPRALDAVLESGKLTKRVKQCMTDVYPTVVLQSKHIHVVDNLVSNGSKVLLNDGAGYISYALSKKVAGAMGLDYIPSAFQIRLRGVKGMVVTLKRHARSKTLNNRNGKKEDQYCLWIAQNQIKWGESFEGKLLGWDALPEKERTLYVKMASPQQLSASEPKIHQMVMVMEELSKEPIDKGQTQQHQRLDKLVKEQQERIYDDITINFANPRWVWKHIRQGAYYMSDDDSIDERYIVTEKTEFYKKIANAGFTIDHPPLLQALGLDRLIYHVLKKQMESTKIVFPGTYEAFMLPDMEQKLLPDEGILCIRDIRGGDVKYQSGMALISRNPCNRKSDVQKIHLLSERDIHTRFPGGKMCSYMVENVLILSAHADCERAPADVLSGGDYDGDLAIIFTDPELVKLIECVKEVDIFAEKDDEGEEKNPKENAHQDGGEWAGLLKRICDDMDANQGAIETSVAMLYNKWLPIADKYGVACPGAAKAARLYQLAIDGKLTPKLLNEYKKEYPHSSSHGKTHQAHMPTPSELPRWYKALKPDNRAVGCTNHSTSIVGKAHERDTLFYENTVKKLVVCGSLRNETCLSDLMRHVRPPEHKVAIDNREIKKIMDRYWQECRKVLGSRGLDIFDIDVTPFQTDFSTLIGDTADGDEYRASQMNKMAAYSVLESCMDRLCGKIEQDGSISHSRVIYWCSPPYRLFFEEMKEMCGVEKDDKRADETSFSSPRDRPSMTEHFDEEAGWKAWTTDDVIGLSHVTDVFKENGIDGEEPVKGPRILASMFPQFQNQVVRYVALVQPDCLQGLDGHKMPNIVDGRMQTWVEILAQVQGQGLGTPIWVADLGPQIDQNLMLQTIMIMHDEKYKDVLAPLL